MEHVTKLGTTLIRLRSLVGAPWPPTHPHPSIAEVTAAISVCNGASDMKIGRLEGHREEMKALTLSVAGVMVAMLMWNLMMLLFY